MDEFEQLLEKSLVIIIEKNYATKYLLRKTLNIDENLAASIIHRLEIDGYISPPDGLLRRTVERKSFNYVKGSYNKKSNQSNNNYKESNNHYTKGKKSAYDILGITAGASKNEIEKAYRAMAKMYHPDKVSGLAPEYMEIAERRMKEINMAYQELKKNF